MADYHNTHTWHEMSRYVREVEPLCRPCKQRGKLTEATQVDHIVAIKDGGQIYDLRNLQPICHPCHVEKTTGKPEFGADGVPVSGWP